MHTFIWNKNCVASVSICNVCGNRIFTLWKAEMVTNLKIANISVLNSDRKRNILVFGVEWGILHETYWCDLYHRASVRGKKEGTRNIDLSP